MQISKSDVTHRLYAPEAIKLCITSDYSFLLSTA